MKKIIGTLGITVIAMTMFFNTTLIIKELNSSDVSLSSLIQTANAQKEQSNFVSGQKMGTVQVQTGTTTVYVPVGGVSSVPITSNTYEEISCCVSTNSKTACNESAQDSRC